MKTTPVNMRLSDNTISKVKKIMKIQNIDSKTQVVVRGISLLEKLAIEIKNGNSIILENKDGSRRELTFID